MLAPMLLLDPRDQFGDMHVAVQISLSLCKDDIPDDWRYFIRVWSIELVHCNGASLRDHEL